jgi:hypothetical protein
LTRLLTSEKLDTNETFGFETAFPLIGFIKETIGAVVSIVIVLLPVLKAFPERSKIL